MQIFFKYIFSKKIRSKYFKCLSCSNNDAMATDETPPRRRQTGGPSKGHRRTQRRRGDVASVDTTSLQVAGVGAGQQYKGGTVNEPHRLLYSPVFPQLMAMDLPKLDWGSVLMATSESTTSGVNINSHKQVLKLKTIIILDSVI